MLSKVFKLAHSIAKDVHTGGSYSVTFGASLKAVYAGLESNSMRDLEGAYRKEGVRGLRKALGDIPKAPSNPNIKILASMAVQALKGSKGVDPTLTVMGLGATVVTKRRMSWIVKTTHSMLELFERKPGVWGTQIMLDANA